jgi:PAS domain-containing protein
MNDDHALARVLEPLYESILDPGRLDDFNVLLGQATHSHLTGILGHDVACGRGSVARVHGADPVRMALEIQPLNLNEDPWVSRATPALATGRIFNSEDLLPNAQMRRSDIFNAYYKQFGVEQQVAAVGHYDGANSITLSICRDDRHRLFDETELGLFQRVVPHWVNAYAIMRRLDLLQQRVQSLEVALDQAPMAMFTLSANRQLLRANAAGEHLLGLGVLHRASGQLSAPGWQDAALQQLLARATLARPDGRAGDIEKLVVQAPGIGAVAITAHPLAPPLLAGEAALLVFAQPVAATNPARLEQALQHLFGLTDAERRLAVAMLQHVDLALAAQACGIALSTAQTRLKVVFDKTGERSQTALVRLLVALNAVC